MAKYRDPKVRTARPYAGSRRQLRSPSHPFALRTRPFQIQPFMISPVLPGETLRNLVCMSRVVTDPIANPLIGWWSETYFFYVKLRDIEFHLGADFVDEMVTSPGTYNPAALRSAAADPKYLHAANATPWAKYATQTVVEYFFRDQGEDWNVAALDGVPLAQISSRSWLDSLTLDENKRVDRDVDLDLNNDGTITAKEMLNGMEIWQAQRDAGLENLDYEDWIRTFGVSVPEVEDSFNKHRPELVRYYRQWQYPTNTVDPATGTPSSAVSWINSFRADKDRLFKEPGFLIGLNVTKPKVYIRDQAGSLASHMETLYNWLPALQHADTETGFGNFSSDRGPLAGQFTDEGGYWIDFRDLLVHGDQFSNFVLDAASSALNVIGADGSTRYPTGTEIDGLFKDAAKNQIRTDGVVTLSIAGRQTDRTPGRNVL